ncbi:hypothetical protein SASPL_156467 [Salvia splendens]|uniref:Uncharacterized protein n=1 Tax=Salvia splendens TaxID=180675 RepID=A0A8X8VWM2_SALSN|nr:hypothetical protein SASPL_156467 [Salvia splendens]
MDSHRCRRPPDSFWHADIDYRFNPQDILNLFFKDSAKPIHQIYNLLVAMIWRHPEHVEFDVVNWFKAMAVYGGRGAHGESTR